MPLSAPPKLPLPMGRSLVRSWRGLPSCCAKATALACDLEAALAARRAAFSKRLTSAVSRRVAGRSGTKSRLAFSPRICAKSCSAEGPGRRSASTSCPAPIGGGN